MILVCVLLSVLNFSSNLWASQSKNIPQSNQELRALFFKNDVRPIHQLKPKIGNVNLLKLGQALYFDKILSGNKNISCATCHHPETGSGDRLPVSLGEGSEGLGLKRIQKTGKFISRNAPPVYNLGFPGVHTTMWDGRIAKDPITGALTTPDRLLNGINPKRKDIVDQLPNILAVQALFPVTSADEMKGKRGTNELADSKSMEETWDLIMKRLGKIPEYVKLFQAAFPEVSRFEELNFGHAAKAIGAFETVAFVANQTPFDLYLAGSDQAIDERAKKGAALFLTKAKCVSCHNGPYFTDSKLYNLAMPQVGPGKDQELREPSQEDRGLALVTRKTADNYKFKTPTLRNLAHSTPFSHSGAYYRVDEVVRHHLNPVESTKRLLEKPLLPRTFINQVDRNSTRMTQRLATLDPIIQSLTQVSFSEEEISDLVHFLKTLSDPKAQTRSLKAIPKSVPSGLSVTD